MKLIGTFIILFTACVFTGIFYFVQKPNSVPKIIEDSTENEKEESIVFPDASLLIWTEATDSATWIKRSSHAGTVFQNKIWVMGGLSGNSNAAGSGAVVYQGVYYFSDVWSSGNGIDWDLATKSAPWGNRRSMQVVVFQDKLWVLGGWGPNLGYKNDVWYSEDGINWIEAMDTAVFPAREGHSLVVFQDKLWILGGVQYDLNQTKNDVWYSEDGINWTEATDSAPWEARQGHNIVSYQDKLWILGRFNKDNNKINDVWYSGNGVDWLKTEDDPEWIGREDSIAVVFQDKLWILGGVDSNQKWLNDVWVSSFLNQQ